MLNFKEHVKYIDEKAFVTQAALSIMMPNIAGPDLFKGIILRVATSIMLYVC